MPPFCIHMTVAKEVAEDVDCPLLNKNMGDYLLGSTAPDMWRIADMSREETHFFDLAKDVEGSERRLLERYPHLGRLDQLDTPTIAFVAGYVAHLVMDEVWIVRIFRPFFCGSSPLASDPFVNVFDRALQYEVDLRERRDRGTMAIIRSHLEKARHDVNLRFINQELLKRWWELICRSAEREPSWDFFPRFARRFSPGDDLVPSEEVEHLLNSPPIILKRVFQYVSEERLDLFRKKSSVRSIEAVSEYLNGDYSRN